MKRDDSKPDWYGTAKGGLGRSPFTEEMKLEVLRKIEEPRGANGKRKKRLALGAAIALCAAAIVWLSAVRPSEPPPAPAVTDAPSPSPSASPEVPSPPPGESESPPEDHPIRADKEIRLAYSDPEGSPGDYPVESGRVEASRIKSESIEVKRVIDVDDLGKFYVYSKNQDESGQLYVGMDTSSNERGKSPKDELYEIGLIGESAYVNDFTISKSNAFGRFGLLVYGVCGANCVTNNWIRFEDGVPVSDFRLNAHAREIDLDEDGVPEVVATESSTVGLVQIYKKFGDRILFVDVNAALYAEHPDSVVYDGNRGAFTAIFSDRTLEYAYKAGEDTLVLMDDSSDETDEDQLIRGGLYDGSPSIRIEAGGASLDAYWFRDPLRRFGFYLPSSIKPVEFEDGYEYKTEDGKGILQLREADEVPHLRKEDDLAPYSDYLGTEFWGDKQNIRYDYFEYVYGEDRRTYISIRYDTGSTDTIRPLLLATASAIRYVPEA